MPEAGIWAALAVGAVATYAWRAAGVALSGRIDPEGAAFRWVGCVAYALLAGLVARMIVLPAGPLAETPTPARLASAAVALAIFFLLRRSVLLGVLAGTGALIALTSGAAWLSA